MIIAFIFALLNLIPYVGALIKLVLITTISLTSNLGADFQTEVLPTTIKVLIGYSLIQLFDNVINQPLIYSKSVKSHPLEIFIVTLIGAKIWGISGMILAIPTYTVLRVVAREFFNQFRFVQKITSGLDESSILND